MCGRAGSVCPLIQGIAAWCCLGGSACIPWSRPDVHCVLKASQQRRETGESYVVLTAMVPSQEGARNAKVLRLRVFSPEEDPNPPCPSGPVGRQTGKLFWWGWGLTLPVTVTTPPDSLMPLLTAVFRALPLATGHPYSPIPFRARSDLLGVCVCVCVCVCFNLILYCPSSLDFPKLEDQHI